MEYLDIVDENDKIIGIMDRKESYKKFATNRLVSVLIFNSEGKIALQKRASTCSFMPGAWALSAGGHVTSGETYLEAAKKELREELGIELELNLVDKIYEDRKKVNGKNHKFENSHYFFESIYEGIYDGDFNYDREDNDEVDDVKFFSLEEIKEMEKNNVSMMGTVMFILKKYYF